MTGATPVWDPPLHRNFGRLVLSCIDASDSESRRIFQHFSRSTRFACLCTAPDSKFPLFFINNLKIFSSTFLNFAIFISSSSFFQRILMNFLRISPKFQKSLKLFHRNSKFGVIAYILPTFYLHFTYILSTFYLHFIYILSTFHLHFIYISCFYWCSWLRSVLSLPLPFPLAVQLAAQSWRSECDHRAW